MATDEGAPPVREGEILAGKYRVDRILGAGGMGVVVAARHLVLDQMVALKFALPSALTEASQIERFEREARAAAKLKSEHAAKVIDFGKLDSGVPYMVMEYLDGVDLAGLLMQQGPLSAPTACDYIVQACEALAEAHAAGIVHRDIKPQNLFLARGVGGTPIVKVLDFGISKLITTGDALRGAALTRTATIMGSPLYMAPEQLRSSRNLDVRIDIWALGVVLYELLAGKPPFDAETMTELTLRIVQDTPKSLTEYRADLPPKLVAIVERCLEKSPDRRFQSAGDLASELASYAPASSSVVATRALALSNSGDQSLRIANFSPTPSNGIGQTMPLGGSVAQAIWSKSRPEPAPNSRNLKIAAALALALAALLTGVAIARRSNVTTPSPSTSTAAVQAPQPQLAPVKESAPPVVTTISAREEAPPATAPSAERPSLEPALLPAARTGAAPRRPLALPAVTTPAAPKGPATTPPLQAAPKDDIPALR